MTFSIYQLKPKFQQLLSPVLKLLMTLHITPNQITLLTMMLSLVFAAMLVLYSSVRWLWMLFPLFMLLRMALNAIDGMLANASQKKTALGTLLNEICDQISDAALYLPFALLPQVKPSLIVLVVVMALLVEFSGVIAVLIGAARRFDGPMGKSDRAFVFSILAIMWCSGVPPIWMNSVLLIVLLLSIVTMINRLVKALQYSNVVPPTP
jgi:CDP-diacylglycerol---glycerol-3-phosphate 3-phosphatidyltransferase